MFIVRPFNEHLNDFVDNRPVFDIQLYKLALLTTTVEIFMDHCLTGCTVHCSHVHCFYVGRTSDTHNDSYTTEFNKSITFLSSRENYCAGVNAVQEIIMRWSPCKSVISIGKHPVCCRNSSLIIFWLGSKFYDSPFRSRIVLRQNIQKHT